MVQMGVRDLPRKKKKTNELEPLINASHMLHGTGIFTYIYRKFKPDVGKYTMHGAYVNAWFGGTISSFKLSGWKIWVCPPLS